MKIELKEFIDQLSEAMKLNVPKCKVAAFIDDDEHIVGWTIVEVDEDGTITPKCVKYKTLRALFEDWYK